MNSIHIQREIKNITEYCILVLLGVYLFYETAGATTLNLPFADNFSKIVLYSLALITVVHSILIVRNNLKTLIASIALGIVYGFIYLTDHYEMLKFIAVFTVALIGVDYKKIIKTYFFSEGIVLIVAVLSALIGARTNLVYFKSGRIRSSWGIIYPTDFASLVLFLCMFYWSVESDNSDHTNYAGIGISFLCGLISWKIAGSRTSVIISILWAVACFCRLFESHIKKTAKRPLIMFLGKVAIFIFPICCFVFSGAMFLYSRGFVKSLNVFTSKRISLAVNALTTYGIKPFGTLFEMVGAGGTTEDVSSIYNFIDCSYALILVRYGWVILVIYLILWPLLTKKQLKNGNKELAITMCLIALHSLSEHHFIEPHYNILLVMPFAMYCSQKETVLTDERIHSYFLKDLTAIEAIVLFLVFGPVALRQGRTIVQTHPLLSSAEYGWKLFFIELAIIFVFILLCYTLSNLLFFLIKKKGIKRAALIEFILTFSVFIYLNAACNEAFYKEMPKESDLLEQDSAAVYLIQKSMTGYFYSDILPDLYQRKFKCFNTSIFSGDELARYKKTTVIVNRNAYSKIMEKNGFLYCFISEKHGVYTNDMSVIQAMQNEGYKLK